MLLDRNINRVQGAFFRIFLQFSSFLLDLGAKTYILTSKSPPWQLVWGGGGRVKNLKLLYLREYLELSGQPVHR